MRMASALATNMICGRYITDHCKLGIGAEYSPSDTNISVWYAYVRELCHHIASMPASWTEKHRRASAQIRRVCL